MKKFILGKKIGMTTLHNDDRSEGITLVECFSKVDFLRDEKKDKYSAVRLEIPKSKKKNFKKEFRVEKTELKKDAVLDVSIFELGDIVNVSGIAKAKGFQGVVKRYGFAGGPASHGGRHNLRQPGSIGSAFPEHVLKGKKMAGRMGGKRKTTKNIEIVFIDKEKNLIGFKGAVPGIPGNIVEITMK